MDRCKWWCKVAILCCLAVSVSAMWKSREIDAPNMVAASTDQDKMEANVPSGKSSGIDEYADLPPLPQVSVPVPEKAIEDVEGVVNDHWLALVGSGLNNSFGGDMMYDPMLFGRGYEEFRDARKMEIYRWPGYPGAGYIPFVIDDALQNLSSTIISAMHQFNDQTCIKFYPRRQEAHYVEFVSENGCWSHVGQREDVLVQKVSLGLGCEPVGTVLHEMNHVLGFYHEHNRWDRDFYLDIFIDNVKPEFVENFKKLPLDEHIMISGFDYDSIMIYGTRAFAKSPDLVTMKPKDPSVKIRNPYSRTSLNKSDLERIRKLYRCPQM